MICLFGHILRNLKLNLSEVVEGNGELDWLDGLHVPLWV